MSGDHGDNPSRHTAGGDPSAPSRFDIVLRGYDRRQVEDHIAGLERTITRQRTELEQARGGSGGRAGSGTTNGVHQEPGARQAGSGALFNTPPGSHAAAGAQRDASGLTPEMISSFTTRLQSILHAAEEEAEEVRSNARAFAHAEEQAGRARLEELERRRQSVLSELSRVRTQLDGLLSQTESGAAAPVAAAATAAAASGPAAASTERTLLNPTPPPAGDSATTEVSSTDSGSRPAAAPSRPEGTPAYPMHSRPTPAAHRTATPPSTPGSPARPGSQPVGGQSPSRPGATGGESQPKPRPTPSPRPRTGPPTSNPPGKDVSAGAEQGSRNGNGGREGGRGDDDGRSAFGSGAR